LEDRPKALQEKIFTKFFEVAEISKFSKEEQTAYEESLKYYRDIKNVVDTSREEGIIEGLEKGMTNKEISEVTGLSDTQIQDIR